MKQKKLLLSLAFALMSMAGHAADNLPVPQRLPLK